MTTTIELKLAAVEERSLAHVTVIELSGIADDHALPELRAACLAALRSGSHDFLIDLSGALKVSPRVFNLFGDLARKAASADGQVLFTGMNGTIRERLESVLQDHPNITLILDELEPHRCLRDSGGLHCF